MSAPLHFHPLTVSELRRDTDDALVLTLAPPHGGEAEFDFLPGQYLTLRAQVNGQEERRSYSICSGLDDGCLRVAVRRVPGGVFSTWLHRHLQVGDRIDALPPQGRFTLLPAAGPRHVLGIAGGSGITPILAIARTLLVREPASRFTLVYGNRSQASTMFKEELEDLKNRHLTRLAVHPVFSREQVESPLADGRITRAKLGTLLRSVVGPVRVDAAYICGPHAMNDEAEAALLQDAALPREAVHVERFGVPPSAHDAAVHAPRPGDVSQARLIVVRDGLTREVDFLEADVHLLQAAARSGMDVPYSCKSGVCGTCRARLLQGQVRMDRNFALEKAEVEAGFVLTCQAHPLTECVTVSFDDR